MRRLLRFEFLPAAQRKTAEGKWMRIIGGELRGRRLIAPRGRKVRPTADRIREAVFNILTGTCRGACVIDLFAGTGALGLEALSRGAESAVFIDIDRVAVDVIRRNILTCGMASRGQAVRWDIRRNLNCLQGLVRTANLVFMDPPYGQGLAAHALDHLHRDRLLSPDAHLVIEQALNEPTAVLEGPYRLADQRRYGKTLVSFLAYVV